MRKFYLLLLSMAVFACTPAEKEELTAQDIIDKAIETAGGDRFLNAVIDFDFRDRHYRSTRNGGVFQYERIFEDSVGTVRDVLNNDGFERYINDTLSITTPDSMKVKYANSVNSVLYFALLPYGLNDPAVIKKRLNDSQIKEKDYYKVQVSFQQEGGGKDHEDIFVYWVEKQNFTIDYFAYSYNTDGGGARFREAINPQVVEGVRLQDYINYKPKEKNMNVQDFDTMFENGELVELSRIELENVSIKLTMDN